MPIIKTKKKYGIKRTHKLDGKRPKGTKRIHKKLNIILDIDETLLQLGGQQDLHLLTTGPHSIKMLKHNQGLLVFLRPFVLDFLDFLFKNFNVGFWTNASRVLAVDYLDALLTNKQRKNINLFIARDHNKNNYYDYVTKKHFKLHSQGKNVKKLSYLFNHNFYKHRFNHKNTILIDDNSYHYAANNGKNIIFINEFHKSRHSDNTLPKIMKVLSAYKRKKNMVVSKTKLPNYTTINTKFNGFFPDFSSYSK